MLKDIFFSITNQTNVSDNQTDFTLRLNGEHAIYAAHFPNNPITPGVCLIQIAKELFSFLRQTDCQIRKVKTAKFSHPLIPTVHAAVKYSLTWEETVDRKSYQVQVKIYAEDIVFARINMELI
ncbi:MAG: hypothetical protein LBQ64_02675 [Bacteroidales bacterium]|jgi:3-hydroxyacyl-[acyl-carrier-protein] dehydratase|nr:hypothetical protein [Bacteroidales bacterium]